jgi:glyoxylase-like metal-dependent hydrolase (beta-lactamase superfamily II)
LPNVKRVTKLPGGSKEALEKSLALLLNTFDDETLVYPGHGVPFALREAKANAIAAARRLRVMAV